MIKPTVKHGTKISEFNYNCKNCKVRCDKKSKGDYGFKDDLKYAEITEECLKVAISINNPTCSFEFENKDFSGAKFPDFNLVNKGKVTPIELKSQRRTFMSADFLLNDPILTASNTVALNESDLIKYIDCFNKEGKDIYIFWFVTNRPCINSLNPCRVFFAKTSYLKGIYEKDQYVNKKIKDRKFKVKGRAYLRADGKGDIDENNVHKGVCLNYHFGISELTEYMIDERMSSIIASISSL